MQIRTKVAVLSLSLALGLSGGSLAAQDKPGQKPGENPAGAMGMTPEQMENMVKAATPGEPHKHLAKMAGQWTFTNKMWMDPSQPPAESTGTMQAETILDGRYVQSVWKGNFMGQPFEGHGTDGWDNLAKKYVSSWVDNMGTGILYSTGTCEQGFKVCTSSGDMIDPMTGQPSSMRSVITWSDDNNFKNELYGKDPSSGKEVKMMEMVVTRKK